MTSRPRRTPFITKKQPTGTGAAKSPQKLLLPGQQPVLRQPTQAPAPSSNNMVLNLGRKRQENALQPDQPKKVSIAQGKKDEGVERILLRPNMGLKKKKDPSPTVQQVEETGAEKQDCPPNLSTTPAIEIIPPPKPPAESLEPVKEVKEVKEVTRKPFELKAPFMIKKGNGKDATSRERIVSAAEDSSEKVPDRPTFGVDAEQQIRQSMKPVLRPPKKYKSPLADEPNDDKIQTSVANGEFESMVMPSPIPTSNYRINLAELEIRQVNVEQQTKHVSEGKIEKQRERVQQLKKLLNLELDSYEETLNLGSITDYELYISKIKSGFVNNSLDQAFDDTAEAQCQSLPLQFADFGHQCPQDKNKSYLGGQQHLQSNSVSLYRFISRVATVVQQLLRPSKTFQMPPIFLLSLKPEFIKVSYCPYPVSLYRAGDLSVATVGEKLYVCRGEVTTLRSIGKFMLAGTKEGSIMLWAGNTDRGSLYDSVYALLNNSDFELPAFCTDVIEKESYFKSVSPIVRILQRNSDEFETLEEFGKIVTWKIVTEQNSFGQLIYKLKPLAYTSLTTLFCDPNLLCFDMESDGGLYICSSKGILRTKSEQSSSQIYMTDSRCNKAYLSKKGNIMYALCQDNSVQIFDRDVSTCLLRFDVPSKGTITDILIPKIQTDSRQLQIYNEFFVTDSKGYAYRYNILQNRTEPREVINKSNSDDRNMIYSSVTLQQNKLDFLFVTRELMTTVVSQQYLWVDCRTGINFQKSAQNFKKIIEDNKRFRELLQDSISL